MIFCVEVMGWVILALLGAKVVYNIGHFLYSVYLAAPLGHNLDLRNYGPWAGEYGVKNTLNLFEIN